MISGRSDYDFSPLHLLSVRGAEECEHGTERDGATDEGRRRSERSGIARAEATKDDPHEEL